MRVNKYIIAIAAGIFSLSMLSGCQSNKKADMNVSIQDGQVQTKLAVAKGSSVSDILKEAEITLNKNCLLYTSPSPRDRTRSRMPSSA